MGPVRRSSANEGEAPTRIYPAGVGGVCVSNIHARLTLIALPSRARKSGIAVDYFSRWKPPVDWSTCAMCALLTLYMCGHIIAGQWSMACITPNWPYDQPDEDLAPTAARLPASGVKQYRAAGFRPDFPVLATRFQVLRVARAEDEQVADQGLTLDDEEMLVAGTGMRWQNRAKLAAQQVLSP